MALKFAFLSRCPQELIKRKKWRWGSLLETKRQWSLCPWRCSRNIMLYWGRRFSGKYWWEVNGWTGCSWSLFQFLHFLEMLWFYDSLSLFTSCSAQLAVRSVFHFWMWSREVFSLARASERKPLSSGDALLCINSLPAGRLLPWDQNATAVDMKQRFTLCTNSKFSPDQHPFMGKALVWVPK